MYTFAWLEDGLGMREVTGNFHDLLRLAALFERQKTYYSISDRMGKLKPNSGFVYWLSPYDSFGGPACK